MEEAGVVKRSITYGGLLRLRSVLGAPYSLALQVNHRTPRAFGLAATGHELFAI